MSTRAKEKADNLDKFLADFVALCKRHEVLIEDSVDGGLTFTSPRWDGGFFVRDAIDELTKAKTTACLMR